MGAYLNTGFEKFKISQFSKIYIDKTELISVLNDYLETEQRFSVSADQYALENQ